jgi:ribosomal protein S18 acetylase RimI-like enzyme
VPTVQVRTGTVDDGAEIIDLLASAVGDRGIRLDAAAHRYRHDPTANLLVAVLEEQIMGLVGFAIDDSEATVLHIAAAESVRRQGIGTRLLAAVDEAVGHRLPLVAETDEMSLAFYDALGFTVESLGRKYPGVERFEVRRCDG